MISLFDLPHARAVELLATGAPVFFPVNPVEFHGRHLSMHNDRHVSLGLARDLHARLTGGHASLPFVVAEDLELGVNPAPGRGSRSTPLPLAKAMVVSACEALAELGAQRVIFTTFHGDPLHSVAIDAGVQRLRALGVRAVSPFNALMHALLAPDLNVYAYAAAVAHIEDPAERESILRGLPLDFHAGFFETSLALHYAGATVDPTYTELAPCPSYEPDRAFGAAARVAERLGRDALARELRFAAWGVAWKKVAPSSGGYTSAPHRATAEAGRVFAEKITELYLHAVEQYFDHGAPPPGPVFAWADKASLGGRVDV